MKTLADMRVYIKVPRARARGAKAIGVRWLDVNMANPGEKPDVRARCVAKEYNTSDRDDIFAGTPALEAVRLMLSSVATTETGHAPRYRRLMIMDVKRAFLHAAIKGEMFIELPEEAMEGESRDMIGLLKRAMYGTREAPQCWQEHITAIIVGMGFKEGKANPCVFHHPQRDVTISVHVDDLLCAGTEVELRRLQADLQKHFESTATILGPERHLAKRATYLNRVIKWTEHGITYEHDPAHVQRILEECGMKDCSSVKTPGVKVDCVNDTGEVGLESKTHLRRIIALLNYIAQDRGDIQFAVKECARQLANPSRKTDGLVKRLARYLKGHPRCELMLKWQLDPGGITSYADSDWAGCERSRRSTSGGIILRGSHPLKFWSRTQASVALSSAEAELIALVKASSECLGLKVLAQEMGMKAHSLTIFTDSSAANAIVHRQGAGRVKHVATQHLWIQERVGRREITIRKAARENNYADLLTHHWTSGSGEKFLQRMSMNVI